MKPINSLLSASITATLLTFATMAVLANDNDDIAPNDVAVNIQQALDIALAQVPGSVIEAELENEDGLVVWEITVASAEEQTVEVTIDANSGVIIEQELDDD